MLRPMYPGRRISSEGPTICNDRHPPMMADSLRFFSSCVHLPQCSRRTVGVSLISVGVIIRVSTLDLYLDVTSNAGPGGSLRCGSIKPALRNYLLPACSHSGFLLCVVHLSAQVNVGLEVLCNMHLNWCRWYVRLSAREDLRKEEN
jgi:hypothetical protein